MEYEGHHPWCNYWNKPVDECRYCKRLFELYPVDMGKDPRGEALVKEFFPNVVVREGT